MKSTIKVQDHIKGITVTVKVKGTRKLSFGCWVMDLGAWIIKLGGWISGIKTEIETKK